LLNLSPLTSVVHKGHLPSASLDGPTIEFSEDTRNCENTGTNLTISLVYNLMTVFRCGSFFMLATLACSAPSALSEQKPTLDVSSTSVLPSDWGKTYSGTITSAALGAERKINIYLPKTFDKTKRKYPVIYLTDGEYYFQRAALAARQLSASGHIPECIVVGIETPDRRQDMTPPGMSLNISDGPDQRAEKFMKFMVDELKPQMESKFRAGGPNVLMGHSHGGILCSYAAAKWRQDLPFQVVLDAPMHLDHDWLVKGIVDSIPAKGNLRFVSLEARFGWTDETWSKLTTAAPKNWKLSRIKMQGEDHETMVFSGFYTGLKELFSDYSAVAVKGWSGQAAFDHYQKLATAYGAPVTPPQFVLERAVADLMFLGKGDLARTALNQWVEDHGELPHYAELLAEINEAEREMKGKETVEDLLALKAPTAAQIAPYLGVWKGHQWVSTDENRKTPITVTFSVVNGHGVAKIVNEDAPPELRDEPAKYLRVTASAVEFGNMNGMTPRGVVARVGRIQGDKLEGESIFRGVFVKERPYRHLFSLTRSKE
jgi:hypothetical protein